MIYLLDANVLIDANRDYYSIERVPEFWDWLQHHGQQGAVKVPLEIFEEVKDGTDSLARWIKQTEVRDALLLDVAAEVALVSHAVDHGYAPDLTDDEVILAGDDILCCGTQGGENMLMATLNNAYTLDYLITGRDRARGYLFQWLERRLDQRVA